MSRDRAWVLDRVRKLLALGRDSGATEAERESAMRMAHKLLLKYNIDQGEAEASGQKPEDRTVKHDDYYGRPWARVISMSIAKLFFCEYIYTSATKAKNTRHHFIGRESNAITACEMGRWLVESILREGKRRQRAEDESNIYFRSFATGASVAIYNRVERMIAEASRVETAEPGTALVVANAYVTEASANREVMDNIFNPEKRLKGRRGSSLIQTDGAAEGRAFGETVSLNKQVGTNPAVKQIQRR
jgi:hypothetical protein